MDDKPIVWIPFLRVRLSHAAGLGENRGNSWRESLTEVEPVGSCGSFIRGCFVVGGFITLLPRGLSLNYERLVLGSSTHS